MKKSSWIQSYTGRQVYPLNPKLEDFNILDIAHALSTKTRYNGACGEFYSVAQHSIIVSNYLEEISSKIPLAKWGLLHDAGETYLPDMARPVKQNFPEFIELEEEHLKLVAKKFELEYPIPDIVKEIDTRLLKNERSQLMRYSNNRDKLIWHPELKNTYQLEINGEPFKIEKMFLPQEAELRFLQRYLELFEK